METRVQKYKVYRASLIKNDSEQFVGGTKYETKTLPLNEVMSGVMDDSDAKYFKKKHDKKIALYALITLGALAVLAGIIILGIFAFGGLR